MRKLRNDGLITVYENKENTNLFSTYSGLNPILGSLDLILNFPDEQNINIGSSFFIEQLTKSQSIASMGQSPIIIQENKRSVDLAYMNMQDADKIFPCEYTRHSGGPAWSAGTVYNPLYGEWNYILAQKGVTNWDWDYGKCFAFTWEAYRLSIPISKTPGNYKLLARIFENTNGGTLKIIVDSNNISQIDSKGVSNSFIWKDLGDIVLDGSQNTLQLININGFNAVSVLVMIPSSVFSLDTQESVTALSTRPFVYILKPEATSTNTTTDDHEIEIFREGDYQLKLKTNQMISLRVDNGNYIQPLCFNNDICSQMGGNLIYEIHLASGIHCVELTSSSSDVEENRGIWLVEQGKNTSLPASPNILSWKKISQVEYEVEVDSNTPFLLNFAEPYYPLWKASVGDKGLYKYACCFSNKFFLDRRNWLYKDLDIF